MVVKKETLNGILLGQRIGDMADALEVNGYDQDIVMIGINAAGKVRIAGRLIDPLRAYGILSTAANLVYEEMTKGGEL